MNICGAVSGSGNEICNLSPGHDGHHSWGRVSEKAKMPPPPNRGATRGLKFEQKGEGKYMTLAELHEFCQSAMASGVPLQSIPQVSAGWNGVKSISVEYKMGREKIDG